MSVVLRQTGKPTTLAELQVWVQGNLILNQTGFTFPTLSRAGRLGLARGVYFRGKLDNFIIWNKARYFHYKNIY